MLAYLKQKSNEVYETYKHDIAEFTRQTVGAEEDGAQAHERTTPCTHERGADLNGELFEEGNEEGGWSEDEQENDEKRNSPPMEAKGNSSSDDIMQTSTEIQGESAEEIQRPAHDSDAHQRDLLRKENQRLLRENEQLKIEVARLRAEAREAAQRLAGASACGKEINRAQSDDFDDLVVVPDDA